MNPTRIDEVKEAFAAVARSLKRVALYSHARDQHSGYLVPAVAALGRLLANAPHVTVAVEPTALLFEGEPVYSEAAREGSLCFRLHRDGVRSLTFVRGVTLSELLTFVQVALPEDAQERREDAVTELWKAELRTIKWTAVSGYRMEEEGSDDARDAVQDASERARNVLSRWAADFVESDEEEARTQPKLITAEERAALDSHDWTAMALSAADIAARIVDRGFASRDQPALAEFGARLAGEMLVRSDAAALLSVLRRWARLPPGFRAELGGKLADRALLARLLEVVVRSPAVPELLGEWLELLPPSAGALCVEMLAGETSFNTSAGLAQAAARRVRECRREVESALAGAASHVSLALLAAVRDLSPAVRASLAARALGHPSMPVRLAAIPLVAADGPLALQHLGPLLAAKDATLRMAAADALATCQDSADGAAQLLIDAILRPDFVKLQREEQAAFHRALGRLGTTRGFEFLRERFGGRRKRLLRRSSEDEQLVAIHGLVAEGTPRALAVLEEMASTAEGPLSSASRAGANSIRNRKESAS